MPVDGLARIDGSCGAGVLDSITTVYVSFADTLNPERSERRIALQVDEPPEREDDVGGRQRRAVGEVDVPPQPERERLCVRARPGRDEQRDRVGKIVRSCT